MNLWDIIVSNSTLVVQAGNNLWDHLNNQRKGGGFSQQIEGQVVMQTSVIGLVEDPAITGEVVLAYGIIGQLPTDQVVSGTVLDQKIVGEVDNGL